LLLLPLALAGCAPRQETFQGLALGTTYTVKVVGVSGTSGAGRQAIRSAIASELEFVDARMSTYREDSELSRFNRFAGSEPFEMSPETLEVFRRGLEISRETEGAFDITVAPLVSAWGFGPGQRPLEVPDEATLAALRKRVGYQKLVIENTGVRKSRPDVRCDLSAIAKGYAVDRIAQALDRMHVRNYMVEVGGEIRTKGRNFHGKRWRIGIERPDPSQRSILRVLDLDEQALATSGDYRNFYVKDGLSLSHLIDPRTGRPIDHGLASVTVVHEECTSADAYATALVVLGPEKGHALAERLGLAALFVIRDEQGGLVQKGTSAFDALE
jgi:thiamine biosynthesis lipoprotein